jgi:DNA-directed RNA polymerase specialized sigma24 family protein
MSPLNLPSIPELETAYNQWNALKKENNQAIQTLLADVIPLARRWAGRHGINPQDTEELINDAVLISLKKMQGGSFEWQQTPTKAYAFSVFKYLAKNHRRKKQMECVPFLDTVAAATASEKEGKEEPIMLLITNEIGYRAAQIIRLYYFQHYSDAEVIRQRLTNYTSINALKSKRSQLLKKLRKVATLKAYY